jgi:SRSO17 transposase
VPDDVEFLTKPQIAIELIDQALSNGVVVKAWTFDELYGANVPFLNALQQRGQSFVGEVPSTFHGWLRKPPLTTRPKKKKKSKKGGKTRKPKPGGSGKSGRRIKAGHATSEVRNLVKYSPLFQKQSWQKYRIKDTQKGPEVWEVKWAVFWRKNELELPGRRHTLIVARNVRTGEVKYFVCNRVPGDKGVSVRWLLRVAFGRWSVEAVFREAKEELGLDHYEVRGWRCVHRHFFVTQLSHLFCSRVRQELDCEANAEDGLRLSLEQVRSAMNTWLESADLKPATKNVRYEKELKKQQYHQDRNRQARESHTKTRNEQLAKLGIDPETIKSCRR